jgi:hypothetical protein
VVRNCWRKRATTLINAARSADSYDQVVGEACPVSRQLASLKAGKALLDFVDERVDDLVELVGLSEICVQVLLDTFGQDPLVLLEVLQFLDDSAGMPLHDGLHRNDGVGPGSRATQSRCSKRSYCYSIFPSVQATIGS